RKIDMPAAILLAIRNAHVAGCSQHRDISAGCELKSGVDGLQVLILVRALRLTPPYRQHRHAIGHGLLHRIGEARRLEGGKIDADARPWRDGAGNLDVAHDLDIGVVGLVRGTVYRDGGYVRHRQVQRLEVQGEVAGNSAAAKFEQPDRLPATVEPRRKVI